MGLWSLYFVFFQFLVKFCMLQLDVLWYHRNKLLHYYCDPEVSACLGPPVTACLRTRVHCMLWYPWVNACLRPRSWADLLAYLELHLVCCCTSFHIHFSIHSCCAHAQVYRTTLVHGFHILYSYTEWNFLFHF